MKSDAVAIFIIYVGVGLSYLGKKCLVAKIKANVTKFKDKNVFKIYIF